MRIRGFYRLKEVALRIRGFIIQHVQMIFLSIFLTLFEDLIVRQNLKNRRNKFNCMLVLVLVLSKGTGEIFKKIRKPLNLPQTKANQLKLISVQHKLKFLSFQLMKNWIQITMETILLKIRPEFQSSLLYLQVIRIYLVSLWEQFRYGIKKEMKFW